MKILEIRVILEDDIARYIGENLGEEIKDLIYGMEDSDIKDVTYEFRDDFQE